MTYHLLNGRGYGQVTVLNVAVCCDAARRAGLLATADPRFSFGAVETVGRYNGGVVLHQDPVANLSNVWVLFHVVESRHVHTGTQRNATRRATPRGTASGVNAA